MKFLKIRQSTFTALLVILLIIFTLCDLFIGSVKIPVSDFFSIIFANNSTKPEWSVIFFDFRLPKTLAAIFVGSALAVSGLQMQTMFRNPLAGPYILGISAGASLGVAVMVLGFSSYFAVYQSVQMWFGNWALAFAAWFGAGVVLLVVLAVSSRVGDVTTILVLGILFTSAIGALVNILQYFSNQALLKIFVIWTMGSLGGVTKTQLYVFVPSISVGLLCAYFTTKYLDVLLLGENYAKTMGLNVQMARFLVFSSTSLLAGTVTAFCGPIGFVDIAIPHITRALFKTQNHKTLVINTMLIGAIVMLMSDIISQLPNSYNSLPINSITAIFGIPFIIWILIKRQK